jgi:hypothetical protein
MLTGLVGRDRRDDRDQQAADVVDALDDRAVPPDSSGQNQTAGRSGWGWCSASGG